MAPSQAARLAAVFIALTIVIGAAGYGIGRGIQGDDPEVQENDGSAACRTYIEQHQDDIQRDLEESYDPIIETIQWEELTQVFVKAHARCTCGELQDVWPSVIGGFVDCVQDH